MLGNLTIYELKVLKGPERLLKMHVVISDAPELRPSIEMLGVVANAVIFQHHKLRLDLPIDIVFASLPRNKDFFDKAYGEILNGVLGIEVVFARYNKTVFKFRYYSEDLEFERKFGDITRYMNRKEINLETHKFTFTNGDLRNGTDTKPLELKLFYTKEEVRV